MKPSLLKLLLAFLAGALLVSLVSWTTTRTLRLKVATLERGELLLEQRRLVLEKDLKWAVERGVRHEAELALCRQGR